MKYARKCLFLMVVLIGISLTALPSMCFTDDAERYPTDPYDYYSIYSHTTGSTGAGGIALSVYADSTITGNTLLKLYGHSATYIYGGSTYAWTYAKIPTTEPGEYLSFMAKSNTVTYTKYAVRIEDNTGTKLAEFYISCSADDKVEIIRSGSYYDLYINGVLSNSYVTTYTYTGDVYWYVGIWHQAQQYYTNDYYTMYVDDITTSSIIGTKDTVSEADDNFTFTWSEQLMRSYPSAVNEITLYSLSSTGEVGEIATWTIPDDGNVTSSNESGYFILDRYDTFGLDFGIYLLEMTRDTTVMTDTYFVYSSIADPIQYPETLFYATPSVDMVIRDQDNHGGSVSGDSSTYLYADDSNTTDYVFNFTLTETPYAFELDLEALYGGSYVNSTVLNFFELNQPYIASVNGAVVTGEYATGELTVCGNFTDNETLSIGNETYEFNSTGNVTGGNIEVQIDANMSTTIQNLLTGFASGDLVTGTAALYPTGYDYIIECTISNPSDQTGYQTFFNVSNQTGMQDDGEDILFVDENCTMLDYWIDYANSSNGSYYTGYVVTPANATTIYMLYGNSDATSSSTSDIFDAFYDASTYADWTTSGITVSNTSGQLRFYNPTSGTVGTAYVSGYSVPSQYIVDARVTQSSLGSADQMLIEFYDGSTSNRKMAGLYPSKDAQTNWEYMEASSWYTGGTYSESVEHILRFVGNDSDTSTGSNYYVYDTTGTLLSSATGQAVSQGTVTNIDGLLIGDSTSLGYINAYFDYILFRKYEATEPTISFGSAYENPNYLVTVTADEDGDIWNSVILNSSCANATWSNATLTGGVNSTGISSTSWTYTIIDWTNLSTYVLSFNPDLTIPGVYGYIKDVDTGDGLYHAAVTISNDTWSDMIYADENGLYYYPYLASPATYTISAGKSGYETSDDSSFTTVNESTTRKDIYLQSSETDGAGVYYEAHEVMFIVSRDGEYVEGINVTATSTSNGTVYGDTDRNGIAVFEMKQNILYTMGFYEDDTLITSFKLYPMHDIYKVDPWALANGTDAHDYGNDWVNVTLDTDATNYTINLTYNITDGSSISLANISIMNGSGTQYTANSTTDPYTFNFSGINDTYLVYFQITNDNDLSFNATWTVSFDVAQTPMDLMPSDWPQWLKNAFVVFFAILSLLFVGRLHKEIGMMASLSIVALAYKFGIFELPSGMNVGILLTIGLFILVAGVIAKRKVFGS